MSKLFDVAAVQSSAGRLPAQHIIINMKGDGNGVTPLPEALNAMFGQTQEQIDAMVDQINAILAILGKDVDVAGICRIKGDVLSLDYLPSNPSKGDCYNVMHSFTIDDDTYAAGTDVVWDGTKWDTLGGRIELDESSQDAITAALLPTLKSLVSEEVQANLNWTVK